MQSIDRKISPELFRANLLCRIAIDAVSNVVEMKQKDYIQDPVIDDFICDLDKLVKEIKKMRA